MFRLMEGARGGDREAMEALLSLFEKDIFHLARYLRLPRDEAVQALIVELIAILRSYPPDHPTGAADKPSRLLKGAAGRLRE